MVQLTEKRRMGATPEQVWAVITDIDSFPLWAESTIAVTEGSGRATAGRVYEERNTVLGPITTSSRWTVTVYEEPVRTVHRGEGITLTRWFELEFVLARAEAGGTDVAETYRFEPSLGPLGALLGSQVFARTLPPTMRTSLAKIEELARTR